MEIRRQKRWGEMLSLAASFCLQAQEQSKHLARTQKNPLNQVLRLNPWIPWWHYEGVLNTNIHTKSPHLEQDIHNSIQLRRVDGFI